MSQIHLAKEHAEEFKSMQSDYAQVVRRRQHNILNSELLEKEKRTQLQTNAKTLDMKAEDHVFKSYGRLFLQMPVETLRTEVKDNIKYVDDELDKLRSKREMLSKTVDQYEKKMKDFIQKNAIKPDEATESEAKGQKDADDEEEQ